MFITLAITTIMTFFTGCIIAKAPSDTPFNFNTNNVVLIDTESTCKFIEKISPTRKIWSAQERDLSDYEVDRLKAMAFRVGGNAITNVIITNPNDPIGQADSYKCDEKNFNKYKSLQNDKAFIQRVVLKK